MELLKELWSSDFHLGPMSLTHVWHLKLSWRQFHLILAQPLVDQNYKNRREFYYKLFSCSSLYPAYKILISHDFNPDSQLKVERSSTYCESQTPCLSLYFLFYHSQILEKRSIPSHPITTFVLWGLFEAWNPQSLHIIDGVYTCTPSFTCFIDIDS